MRKLTVCVAFERRNLHLVTVRVLTVLFQAAQTSAAQEYMQPLLVRSHLS